MIGRGYWSATAGKRASRRAPGVMYGLTNLRGIVLDGNPRCSNIRFMPLVELEGAIVRAFADGTGDITFPNATSVKNSDRVRKRHGRPPCKEEGFFGIESVEDVSQLIEQICRSPQDDASHRVL